MGAFYGSVQIRDGEREAIHDVHEELARKKRGQGNEMVFRLAFDTAGERLFVATRAGVRVYRWREVAETAGDTPGTEFSVDVGPPTPDPSGRPVTPGGHVYDLAYDHDRERLLFGGLDGRIRYLDLSGGRDGTLLEPPGRPPVLRLGLSRDRSALILTVHPGMFARGKSRRAP